MYFKINLDLGDAFKYSCDNDAFLRFYDDGLRVEFSYNYCIPVDISINLSFDIIEALYEAVVSGGLVLLDFNDYIFICSHFHRFYDDDYEDFVADLDNFVFFSKSID